MSTPSGNLEYAASLAPQDYLRRAAIYRRIVLWCALAPMALGVGIVLFYWLFDWDWLVLAGMVMLPLGGVAVVTGWIFSFLWMAQKRAFARKSGTAFSKRGWLLMGMLLLANFVVAVACVAMGATLATEQVVYVSVYNDTGATLDRCVVRADWWPRFHGALMAGDSMFERFRGNRVTGLRLHVEQGGVSKDVPLVNPGGGGGVFDTSASLTIHVRAGLEVDVESKPGG